MRYRQMEYDFNSSYGNPMLVTSFPQLERSVAKFYTKEIFALFMKVLFRASWFRVINFRHTLGYTIYKVMKYKVIGKAFIISSP